MKATLDELFSRFVQSFPQDPGSCLRVDQVQRAESNAALNAQRHSIIVHGSHDKTDGPLALIVMTAPAVSADDPALLEFAVRRSRAHKSPYFVTWTLRDAMLWRTPKAGTPAARDAIEKLRDYPDIYEIAASESGPVNELVKLQVLQRGREIQSDLERLLKDEALELVQIDATYFVHRLLDAVHRLLPIVAGSLQHRLQAERQFAERVAAWALQQSIPGSPGDPDFAESVARQFVYRLLGKILFYQSLRRSARHLPKLDLHTLDSAQVLPGLRAAFAEALKIDYHAVFKEDLPDQVQWPSDASRELAELVHDLNSRDFAHLPQDVVGTVFERLIPPEERHGLGQYFTNENLCDLIIAFCVRSPNDKVLDPTCGTGTFLIRAYDRLRSLGRHDHSSLLAQLWGVDIAPFPAELATINLFRQRIAEHGNFPRVVCEDFFRLSPGQRFPFPPPKMDLDRPEVIEEPIPEFDAIIGNFPYVSADQIENREINYLQFLHDRLLDGWFPHYSELFEYQNKKEHEHYRKSVAAGQLAGLKRDGVQHKISGFADLYVYLFFHAARFLKPGGRIGIVTSNAWLDVAFGRELKEFFLKRFRIIGVLESRCEPWFIEAAVNTVVTILERSDDHGEQDANLVHFVKVKRPLAELIPGDPTIDAPARWSRLGNLATRIERAGIKFGKTHPLGVVTEEHDDLRIRILRQSEMRDLVERSESTAKWGIFLRAPDVVFEISHTCKDKLCSMGALADMKRGSVTGVNEFYHVSPEVAAEYRIEDEYLQPLIKAAEDSSRQILVDPVTLGKSVFVCRRTKAELKRLRHTGALRYIEWGEEQKFASGKLAGLTWPNGIEVKNRKPGWYALPEYRGYSARIFWMKAYHDTYLQRFSTVDLIPDQRLYFLEPIDSIEPQLLAAILNSSLVALQLESIAPVTAGEGVCEVRLEDARDCLFVPDLRTIPSKNRLAIQKAFQPLLKRQILRLPDEVKQADRQAFDAAVLTAIGIDPKKLLGQVYEGLLELLRERIELGQMRGKARKTRARGERIEKKLAEEVLDEVLPEGPSRFPDEFFSTTAATAPKTAVTLPDQSLVFDASPMFMGIHTADNSFQRNVKSAAEGKFLLYAQRAGQRVAQLPEKTVEVTRTVANYEKYLRELRRDLYEAYYRRTLDTKAASRLTIAAFERFRLPAPGQD